MVKINGVKVQTEGRKPWADAPSEPIPGQRRKRNGIYPGWDSPEKIQQCLHCTNPDCSGRCPSKIKEEGRPSPHPHAGGLPREGEAASIP